MTPTPLHPTNLYAVAVPSNTTKCVLNELQGRLYIQMAESGDMEHGVDSVELPPGEWKFIGLVTKDTIDFDAEKYVECISRPLEIWKNYHIDTQYMEYAPKSAADSFRSLLSANECFFENPLGDEPKEYKGLSEIEGRLNELDIRLWDKAQSKVHECWAIIEKV